MEKLDKLRDKVRRLLREEMERAKRKAEAWQQVAEKLPTMTREELEHLAEGLEKLEDWEAPTVAEQLEEMAEKIRRDTQKKTRPKPKN